MSRGNVADDAHYCNGEIQPIDLIESQNLGFREGSIIKYVTRWRQKNGLRDLYAARWMMERLIYTAEREEGDRIAVAALQTASYVNTPPPAHHQPLEEPGSFIIGPGNRGMAEFDNLDEGSGGGLGDTLMPVKFF